MPEKRCEREDCGRPFDVDADDVDADSVRCPSCGTSQSPPEPSASSTTARADEPAGETRVVADEGVTVTITIDIQPT